MEINGNNFVKKNENKFYCTSCNHKCSYLSDWERHVITRKHLKHPKMEINGKNGNNFDEKNEKHNNYTCKHCNKNYKTIAGLWKHNKKCNIKNINDTKNIDKNENENENSDKDLIIMLIKQNSDLKNMMIEVIKNGTHNTINNTNSHNKTFNLQVFLNETCKDAMNINEFVSSIKLQIDDLETTGRLGYSAGISKIILNNLQCLETHERPFHCSDPKREILYIKNNNQWIKENEDKTILTKAIKIIANENIKQINEFKKLYPDCTNSESNKNNLYLKIVSNAMSGSTKEETNKNISKIISNVVKEVIIKK